jgi:hypothetical protein
MSKNNLRWAQVALLGIACGSATAFADTETAVGRDVTMPSSSPMLDGDPGELIPGDEDPAFLDDELAQWRRGRWICRVVGRCHGGHHRCVGGRRVYFGEGHSREHAWREALHECRRDFGHRDCDLRGCSRRGGGGWDDHDDRDDDHDRDRDHDDDDRDDDDHHD